MEIIEAAAMLRPGTAWNYDEERGLIQAEDGTSRVSVPTMNEIQAFILNDPLAYREKRRKEYPYFGDQLDALWKGGQAASDMYVQVMAVKAKYPKPE